MKLMASQVFMGRLMIDPCCKVPSFKELARHEYSTASMTTPTLKTLAQPGAEHRKCRVKGAEKRLAAVDLAIQRVLT
jgi:hypothetical protein